jgi:ATP phosphoribosyltransferase
MIVRSQDVPIFVERGAAALGLTGLDTLRERGSNLYELCDLGIGRCRLSIAGPAGLDLAADPNRRWRVASKYPVLTAAAFRAAGRCAEILKLGGTLETVPESGLADCIVDLVETGRTLKTHGLVELEVILEVTTRVVSAPSTYVRHHATIAPLVRRLMEAAP